MKNLIITILIFITIMLISLNKLISTKTKNLKTANSPFECGFNNISSIQNMLSHNFFMFNLLFIILELEIILIMPFLTNEYKSTISNQMFFIMMSLILLTMMKEWKKKILEWSK